MYWYCKNCGGMNYDDSKFCTHCGTVSEANESNNNMGAVASQQIINNSNHSNYNYNNNNSIEVAFLLILSATLISPFLKLYEISGLTSIFALFSRDSLDNMSTSFSMHDFYKSFTTLSHLSANGNFAEKFRPIGIALVLGILFYIATVIGIFKMLMNLNPRKNKLRLFWLDYEIANVFMVLINGGFVIAVHYANNSIKDFFSNQMSIGTVFDISFASYVFIFVNLFCLFYGHNMRSNIKRSA